MDGLGNLGAVFVSGGGLFGIDPFEPLRECPLPYIRAYGFPQGIQFTYLALGKIGLDNSRFGNHWLSPDAVILKLGTIGLVGGMCQRYQGSEKSGRHVSWR